MISHLVFDVAILLVLAKKLNIVSIINKHTLANRKYWPKQPVRNDLTAGITLLLAAIGRICMPTSKRGWYDWAKKELGDTNMERILQHNKTSKVQAPSQMTSLS